MTVKGNDDGDRGGQGTGGDRFVRGRADCDAAPAPRRCTERPRLRPYRRRADLPCDE